MAYDEETAQRVRAAFAGQRDITTKVMMGGLVFMVKGAMCCSVSGRGGLLVRVDPQARERMLGEAHVQPADMGRRIMTGFVRVAADGYRTDAALKRWVERGLDGIAAQADKPSRRKPSNKKAASSKKTSGTTSMGKTATRATKARAQPRKAAASVRKAGARRA
jgi:TfoX/Sxy family transcriptional regulator of competence genes